MNDRELPLKPCRDCGHLLGPTERGCPRCAMNAEAERMIERYIWGRAVPIILIILLLAIAGWAYFLR